MSERKRFVQKKFKSYKYSEQLKEGLKSETTAYLKLVSMFPSCTFRPGPYMKADAIITSPEGIERSIEIKSCKFVERTSQIFDEISHTTTNGTFPGGSEKAINDGCSLYVVRCESTGWLYMIDVQHMFETRNKLIADGCEILTVNNGRTKGITINLSELKVLRTTYDVKKHLGFSTAVTVKKDDWDLLWSAT